MHTYPHTFIYAYMNAYAHVHVQINRIKYATAAKLGDALRIISTVEHIGNGRYVTTSVH
jgi:hypothetical protein